MDIFQKNKADVLQHINNIKKSQLDIDAQARKHWKTDLSDYTFIDNTRYSTISCGKMVAYIDLDFNTLSYGLVSKLYSDKKHCVTKILLKSLKYDTYWKINVKKYHIFQSKSQTVGIFRKMVDNLKFKVKE